VLLYPFSSSFLCHYRREFPLDYRIGVLFSSFSFAFGFCPRKLGRFALAARRPSSILVPLFSPSWGRVYMLFFFRYRKHGLLLLFSFLPPLPAYAMRFSFRSHIRAAFSSRRDGAELFYSSFPGTRSVPPCCPPVYREPGSFFLRQFFSSSLYFLFFSPPMTLLLSSLGNSLLPFFLLPGEELSGGGRIVLFFL